MQRTKVDFRGAARFRAALAGVLLFSGMLQTTGSMPAGAATMSACVKTIEPLANANRTVKTPLDAKHYLNTPAVVTACGSVTKAVAELEKKNSAACKSLLEEDLPQPHPDFGNNGDIMKNCAEPSHARALYKPMLAAYVPPAASSPAPNPTPCTDVTKAAQGRLCSKMRGKPGKH